MRERFARLYQVDEFTLQAKLIQVRDQARWAKIRG
jgi:hypothetical protein